MSGYFNNPILELTFVGADIEGAETQIIDSQAIVKGSISVNKRLLSDLKSASDTVSLALMYGLTTIEDIIKTESDIKAVLKEGDDVLFTGYVSTNFDWSVNSYGEDEFEITLEDVGTRLLRNLFNSRGEHFFNTSPNVVIEEVCEKAGITVSPNIPAINTTVTCSVKEGTKCKDILDQLVYELNYAYYFDRYGHLNLYKIDCESLDNIPIVNSQNLAVLDQECISLSKEIQQYRSARVSYNTLASADNYLIYRNTTDQSEDYPYCNMELKAGQAFDGVVIYTPEPNTVKTNPTIEAVNAEAETKLVGSNEIVAVTDIDSIGFDYQGSNFTRSVTTIGGKNINIYAENIGSSTGRITQFDVYGSIVYVKNLEIIYTDEKDLTVDSNLLLEEELTWIHDKDNATRHANLIAQYYRYAGSEYSFYSFADLDEGAVIHLEDDIHTGLSVNVLITAKTYNDTSNVIEYEAVGVSVYNLDADVVQNTVIKPNVPIKGDPGDSGPAGADPEPFFTVTIEPNPVLLSVRTKGPTTVRVTAKKFNEPDDGSYKIGANIHKVIPAELTDQIKIETDVSTVGVADWIVTIPDKVYPEKIIVGLSGNSGGSVPLNQQAYPEITFDYGSSTEPIKVGVGPNLPTEDSLDYYLVEGDYFFNNANGQGLAYRWNGSEWEVADESHPNFSTIMANVTSDIFTAIENGAQFSDNITANQWGYFKYLVSKYVSAEMVSTTNLELREPGSIFAGRYDAYGNDHGEEGDPGIFLKWDGTSKLANLYAENADVSGKFTCDVLKTTNNIPQISSANVYSQYQSYWNNATVKGIDYTNFERGSIPSGNYTLTAGVLFKNNSYAAVVYDFNVTDEPYGWWTKIYSSRDMQNWTERRLFEGLNHSAIVTQDPTYMAVIADTDVYYSTNGESWTLSPNDTLEPCWIFKYLNDRYFCIGDHYITTFTDITDNNSSTVGLPELSENARVSGLDFGNDKYVMCFGSNGQSTGSNYASIWYSTKGSLIWSPCPGTYEPAYWGGVVFGAGKFIVYETAIELEHPERMRYSTDGVNWYNLNPSGLDDGESIHSFIFDGYDFVILANKYVYTSPNGFIWTRKALASDAPWYIFACDDNVIMGSGGSYYDNEGVIVYRTNISSVDVRSFFSSILPKLNPSTTQIPASEPLLALTDATGTWVNNGVTRNLGAIQCTRDTLKLQTTGGTTYDYSGNTSVGDDFAIRNLVIQSVTGYCEIGDLVCLDNSVTIGKDSSGERVNYIYCEYLDANSRITGNVNSQNTSYRVWGAVAN